MPVTVTSSLTYATALSNRSVRARRRKKSAPNIAFISRFEELSSIFTSLSADVYGSGRSSTASTTLKTPVLAPMPSARIAITPAMKVGFLRRARSPWWKS